MPAPGTWPFDTVNSFHSCPVFMLLCAGICYKQVNGGIAAGKKKINHEIWSCICYSVVPALDALYVGFL